MIIEFSDGFIRYKDEVEVPTNKNHHEVRFPENRASKGLLKFEFDNFWFSDINWCAHLKVEIWYILIF